MRYLYLEYLFTKGIITGAARYDIPDAIVPITAM
jgi:hypothetical protein